MALSDEKREQVKALLATGMAKDAVAKTLKISWDTVNRISQEDPDKIEEYRESKKQEMIDKIWDSLVDAADLGHDMIKQAKEGTRDIPLNQISTYYGTLYDKMALMKGDNTSNVGVNGGLTVVFDKEMG